MPYADIIYEKQGRVARITINRPHVLNAISVVTQRELIAAVDDFSEDPEVWIGLLTGAGDRAFSAGHDMKWQYEHPEEHDRWVAEERRKKRKAHWHLEALYAGDLPREVWKPIVAAVNGYCLGSGLELAMHCDVIIASETATFGLPEVHHGWPPFVGSFLLPRHIPQKIAMEMLLTGDRISAARAYELGLVSRVVPPAALLETATAFTQRLCANSPLGMQAAKELALRGLDMPLNHAPLAYHLMTDSVMRLVDDSQDKEEGYRAFVEKRAPVFRGR